MLCLYTPALNSASPSQPYLTLLTTLGEEGTATAGVSGPSKDVAQGLDAETFSSSRAAQGLHTHTRAHTHSIDCVPVSVCLDPWHCRTHSRPHIYHQGKNTRCVRVKSATGCG